MTPEEGNVDEAAEKAKPHEQSTCTFCFLFWVIVLLILAISLYFAVFQPKNFGVRVQRVRVNSLTFGGYPQINFVNVSLNLLVSVKNPNQATLYYSPTTAYLYHRGAEVGQASISEGELQGKETQDLSIDLTTQAYNLMEGASLYVDLASNALLLTTYTVISGHVTVLGVFAHDAAIATNCTVDISFSTRNIQGYDCN